MMISVHTPKTGGVSFKNILKDNFGRSLVNDYRDLPINYPIEVRTKKAEAFNKKFSRLKRKWLQIKGVACIHGHFLPYKYKKYLVEEDSVFITWLRDPIERLLSHYYYWKRAYNKNSAPLHKQVVEENWSLEKFCFSEEMKNLYVQYFWKFPLDHFDFIGITEQFESEMQFFINIYLDDKKDFTIPHFNRNEQKSRTYADDLDIHFLEELKSFHSGDYDIYNHALKKRSLRREKSL